MRALRRALRILTAPTLPVEGRVDLLKAALRRRVGPSRPVPVRLGPGTAWISADSALFDYTALYEIFVGGCYGSSFAGAVVLDVGAHRGYFGALALTQGARAVYSFEPEEANFAALERLAAEFRASGHDWTVVRTAVGASEGARDLYVTDRSWSHSLYERPGRNVVAVQHVGVRPLTSALAAAVGFHPDCPVIVKLDVEGSECEILLETPDDAWSPVDEVWFEYEGIGDCTADQLVDRLRRVGMAARPTTHRDVHHMVRGG
jgi:FkbM family methyltransferase